jgi:hypothetical protein
VVGAFANFRLSADSLRRRSQGVLKRFAAEKHYIRGWPPMCQTDERWCSASTRLEGEGMRLFRWIRYFVLCILASTFPGVANARGMPPKVVKISVLSSGTVLLDGKPIGLADLDNALQAAKGENAVVWYYREAGLTEPPPQAKEVIDLIIKHRLPIRLSSKKDFSDAVDEQGTSHPAETQGPLDLVPRMPEVEPVRDIEKVFADARRAAAEKKPRQVVIVTPERKIATLPVPEEAPPGGVKAVESIVPSSVKRKIAVIGYTGFIREPVATSSLFDANKAIPFFGFLMGFVHIGHSVWVFEGHPTALAAGCRDADLLLVDSDMVPFLPKGWEDEAIKVMHSPNILVHDRATFRLLVIRRLGSGSGPLEFRK